MKKLAPLGMGSALVCACLGLELLAAGASASAQAPAREHVITMANMKYGRIPAGLKVGDTIVWVNRDTVPHTATARDKSFDLRVNPGRSARMTLKKAGSVPFYCILHPAMRGTIAVAAN